MPTRNRNALVNVISDNQKWNEIACSSSISRLKHPSFFLLLQMFFTLNTFVWILRQILYFDRNENGWDFMIWSELNTLQTVAIRDFAKYKMVGFKHTWFFGEGSGVRRRAWMTFFSSISTLLTDHSSKYFYNHFSANKTEGWQNFIFTDEVYFISYRRGRYNGKIGPTIILQS